eukprot:5045346-Prymnesium_polylepis.1
MAATLMMRKQPKHTSRPVAGSAVEVVKRVPLVQSTWMQEELENIKSYVGDATDDRSASELKRLWDIRLQACLEEFQPDSYVYLQVTTETEEMHADMIKHGWCLIAEDTSGKYYVNQQKKDERSKEADPDVETTGGVSPSEEKLPAVTHQKLWRTERQRAFVRGSPNE